MRYERSGRAAFLNYLQNFTYGIMLLKVSVDIYDTGVHIYAGEKTV